MKKLSFLPLLAAAGMFAAPSANAAVAFHNHILIDNFEEAGFGNTLAPATMTLTAPSALGGSSHGRCDFRCCGPQHYVV
ncbi:MAG: hypothetical protein R3F11_09985 [Verrucomicrobiales bacterium]